MTDKKMTFRKRMSNLKRGYKICNELAPGFVARECFTAASDTLIEYACIYLSGVIVSIITNGGSMENALKMSAVYALINIVLGIAVVIIAISKYEQTDQGYTNKAKMLISKKCTELDYIRAEDPETHRLKGQAENYLYGTWSGSGMKVLLYSTRDMFSAVSSIAVGICICFKPLFLTSHDPDGFMGFIGSRYAPLALLIFYGVLIIINSKVTERRGEIWSEHFDDKEFKQMVRVVNFFDNFQKTQYQRGKDIRIYNQSEMLVSEREKYGNADLEHGNSLYKKLFPYEFAAPLITFLIDLLTYGFIIARTIGGMYSPAETVVLVMSITKLMNSVMTAFNLKIELFDLAPLNIQHIFDFLDIPDEKYKGTIPTEKRDDNEYEFEFKHVYFKYPNSENYVLQDINLKWCIGEKMALVGRNGSGKSTLVKLLCRLYDPTEGEITLNGIDIKKYNYDEYMALFSVVFQDSKLFSFSLAENVAADTEYDAALVENSVRRAGLSERLGEMPDGIKTCLYKDFDEEGVEISGGEAQKLCLARAIYKGSPFIVLDEPTATLDPISEHDIYTKFNSIVGTKTAIYISHRLSSCRFCDDITVLDNGKIAERGSHSELLSYNGIYAEMWSAQAEYYKDTAGELFA